MAGDTPLLRSNCACLCSASRSACSSCDVSAMPSSVVSAFSGPASNPPRWIAVSADCVPSLQIKIFIGLEFVSGHERINHDGRADQWQRDKGKTDFRTGKILCRDCAYLRADGCARVHDQCNE